MKARDGFTLVELIVSMVLLSVVLISLSGATVRYVRGVSEAELQASALLLVNDRLEQVQLHPSYLELEEEFAGYEESVGGIQGASRTTTVDRETTSTETGVVDLTRVTVQVLQPGMRDPVERTIIVGAP